jgi:aminobenzoyl-glutamate utilization protein B
VITRGGDQPNVVPPSASVWYYLREADYEHIMDMWRIADEIARGAALMTGTTFTSQVFGSAWPQHFNKPIAEAMYENVKRVGMPQWSQADQTLAKALQRELKAPERGLPDKPEELRAPPAEQPDPVLQNIGPTGGASDDIGDVSWVVPTVTLRYPSNISGLPGHHWANAIAMATPIAHQGVVAGAKVQAMTMLDILLHPELMEKAWDYFRNVQTKDVKYRSFLRPDDKPAIWLNREVMEQYRPRLKELFYDPSRYDTYLDQLGIKYPTVRP